MDDVRRFARSLPCASAVSDARLYTWLNHFVRVTEPEVTFEMRFITLSAGFDNGATSRKPGNIRLNWRTLLDLGPDTALAVAGAVGEGPFVRGLVALYVWNRLWRASEEELSSSEASVIETLWANAAHDHRIASGEAFRATNEARVNQGLMELTKPAFEHCLDRLAEIDCIELEDGSIWLREWVQKKA